MASVSVKDTKTEILSQQSIPKLDVPEKISGKRDLA
jgi:hypothetical protein